MPRSPKEQVSAGVGGGVVERRELLERLEASLSGRVTVVTAPAGSGKTLLLRSWVESSGRPAAWAGVERSERDPQRFWRSVAAAIDDADAGVRPGEGLPPTPSFDGGAAVLRLIAELDKLTQPLILVIDDLHELESDEATSQLELLLDHQPSGLHVVLASRHDPKLGLHRLRVAGLLTEVRAADLRFSLEEAEDLLASSGVELHDESVTVLHERTEGWAAGLRMASLWLADRPEPDRLVAEFSGNERTVADYLLAEVLDRQPPEVRELLLRTSILDRVSGPLADAMTGGAGAESTLQALEEAGAFVVSVDAGRSWFRYHHLFADLLQLELRRTDPEAFQPLHGVAARWYAENGYCAEAIAQAQAAGEWDYATGMLAEHFFSLALDGRAATAHELLHSFPLEATATDPELAALRAADQLTLGSLDRAAENIAIAEGGGSTVPGERRRRFEASLALARLSLARQRGDLGSVLEEIPSLRSPPAPASQPEIELNDDLRLLALMNLGIVEAWFGHADDGASHLEEARELAQRRGRSYVEVGCLAHLASTATRVSFARGEVACREATAAAEAAGWGADPVIAPALVKLGVALAQTGRFEEAERCLDRAERVAPGGLEPAIGFVLCAIRGAIHAARGQHEQALESYRRAERMRTLLSGRPPLELQIRCAIFDTRIALGEADEVGLALGTLDAGELSTGVVLATRANLAMLDNDPSAALDLLAPVIDGSAPVHHYGVVIHALLRAARAHDALRDSRASRESLEQALDLAEPDRLVLPFVLSGSRKMLQSHPGHQTAHGAFIAEILDVLSGQSLLSLPDPLAADDELSDAELRVLRYLPSNLSATEIAAELFISVNTVKTHMRHIYAKLNAHSRTEALERARALDLLAPSGHPRRVSAADSP